MRTTKMNKTILNLLPPMAAMLLTATAYAAVPGITGASPAPAFSLTAQAAYLNQPDGEAVYSWGYGCNGTATFATTLGNVSFPGANCQTMQVPGPTLIVHENDVVTVSLQNGLPAAAGNTSILFPGFQVCAGTISGVTTTNPAGTCAPSSTDGVAGLLTQEAAPGGTVTYQFVATSPGTRAYYSGTQGDLQIEMGLYGAIIVLPATVPANCTTGYHASNLLAEGHWGESDYRLSQAAYDHPGSCYDREYLFQWAEMDPRIHKQAEAEVGDPARVTACGIGAGT